jgi:hypothetical protein
MRPIHRRLTIVDGVVMTASMAVALSISRLYTQVVLEFPGWGLRPGMSLMEVWYWVYRRNCMLLVSSIILAAALLALRMRQPRPRFRRLMRQPGTVACWAIVFVVVLRGLGVLEGTVLARIAGLKWHQLVFDLDGIDWGYYPALVFSEAENVAPQMCLAVAVSWVLLLVSGQWRPEPSWIDRMGRALGMYYVLMIPIFLWFFPFKFR